MIRKSLYLLLALVLALSIGLLAGCGGDDTEDTTATTEAGMEGTETTEAMGDTGMVDGAAIYSAQCASCHGEDGQGDVPLSGLEDVTAVEDVVRNGAGDMPGLGDVLTDEEIQAVAEYSVEQF